MKIWTYQEAKAKALGDNDLADETFISPNEMSGYFNEALQEAAAEIIELNQDYLKTYTFMPLVAGIGVYPLPANIYANKIRGIMYQNGSLIYEIKRFRRRNKFEMMAYVDQFGAADYYKYDFVNHMPGQASIVFHPVSRETAILPPSGTPFTPAIMHYIRNVNRIPMVAANGNPAELCNPELVAPTQVNIGSNTIQTYAGSQTFGIPQLGVPGGYPGSISYITGDVVQVQAGPGGALPAPLAPATNYYVIANGSGVIKLATSLANAFSSTALTLTSTGSVYMIIQVGATTAIVMAQLIDVPEFITFITQWVRCRSMGKEDPRLASELETLTMQKKEMVDTLTNAVPDDDDEIQADLSHYSEMS